MKEDKAYVRFRVDIWNGGSTSTAAQQVDAEDVSSVWYAQLLGCRFVGGFGTSRCGMKELLICIPMLYIGMVEKRRKSDILVEWSRTWL